jgi:hypothetical protein
MPFTVSHVAAVLPMVGRSDRLPAAALVIGSMVPDYPWFLTRGRSSGLSHSLLGVVTVDLAAGLLAFLLWRRVAQAPVRDLVPRAVGTRLPRPPGLRGRDLGWAALAVVLGALTHVVWDSFTHADRWGVELVPWLQEAHHGRSGWVWGQEVSSVLGLLVLALWSIAQLVRTHPDGEGLRSTAPERQLDWLVVAAGVVAGTVVGAVRSTGPVLYEVYAVITFGGAGLALGVALACSLWWRPARATDAGQ